MRKILGNKITFLTMLLALLLFSTAANASTPESLSSICTLLLRVRFWIFSVAYTLSAMAIAVWSIDTSILGKFSGNRLIAIVVGLFVLSTTQLTILFITKGAGSMHYCPTNGTVWF